MDADQDLADPRLGGWDLLVGEPLGTGLLVEPQRTHHSSLLE